MNPSVDDLGRARIALARLQEAGLGSMGVDDITRRSRTATCARRVRSRVNSSRASDDGPMLIDEAA